MGCIPRVNPDLQIRSKIHGRDEAFVRVMRLSEWFRVTTGNQAEAAIPPEGGQ